MATYTELASITEDPAFGDLIGKVRVAVVSTAVDYLDLASPTANQVLWAMSTLDNPAAAANGVLWYVIGANKGASLAAILSASDTAVQTNVDAAVAKLVA